MSTPCRLIDLLADGRFRSGEWLGQQLGVSRAAVWKQVRNLEQIGLDVQAVRGKGYRLARPIDPLDADRIRRAIPETYAARLDSIEVFGSIDSTSEYLKRARREGAAATHGRVCLAESQTAGRGRRGRRWVSPYGSNLYLSLAWRLSGAELGAGGFSLAMAVAVLRALRACGVEGLGLKWPNDILFRNRKLAGILLDLVGESGGPFDLVIGVGINLHVPAHAAAAIDQPWADLSQAGVAVERNRLAACVLETLVQAIDSWSASGLDAFLHEWHEHDQVAGRSVELHQGPVTTRGLARGIDASGALLIEHDGSVRSYHAGEVSVRLS